MPVQWERVPPWLRERYLERYYEYRNMSMARNESLWRNMSIPIGPASLKFSKMNIEQVLKFILGVNSRTCKQ